MKYNFLGRTDIRVSLLCLGSMTFGEQNTPEEAFGQMDYALEKGINFFDTAELYAIPPKAETYGRTEEIIGAWFQKSGKRKDVILATKVVGSAPQMPWIRGGARLDRRQIFEAAEGSLKRLKTDYIDLYQIHWPQRPVNSFGKLGYDQFSVTGRESDQILESLQTLTDLIRAGKIRHVGLSNETAWGLMTFLDHAKADASLAAVVSIQNPYSLLNRTFDVNLAEMAMQEKTGLLAYAPLAAGALTGKYLNGQVPKGSRWDIDPRGSRYKKPGMEQAVASYLAIAKKYGLDPAQMALAFVNTRPFLTSTIIGATKMEQLKTNIASIDVVLGAELLREIEAIHLQNANPCP